MDRKTAIIADNMLTDDLRTAVSLNNPDMIRAVLEIQTAWVDYKFYNLPQENQSEQRRPQPA